MRTNSEIIDLIKTICAEKDISLSELARRTDMAKSAISRYFNKSRQFPLNRVNDFAKALNTTPEYLLDVTPNNIILNDINTIYSQLEQQRQEKVFSYAKKQLDEQESLLRDEPVLYEVKVTEKLAAGVGYPYQENNETYSVYTYRDDLPNYDLACTITGDSMEPKYHDGDVALIQLGYDNIHGGIYAVDYDGKTFLKKVYFEGGYIRLVSLNKKYDDMVIDLPVEQGTYLNIVGKVVGSFTPVEV